MDKIGNIGGDYLKRMIRMMGILAITVLSVSLFASLQSLFVSASVPFEQINGTLGGANYLIRFPENWQGDLVVLCRGYSHLMSGVNIQFSADRNLWITDKGYALAVSDYGEAGFCCDKAIVRVHQLTEFVISNYQVSGNVFLIGVSMGGNVALQLGAKYPELYDGVINMAGPVEATTSYETKTFYASLSNDADLAAALVADGCLTPPFPSPTIAAFRQFCQEAAEDIVIEYGGTPDEKPNVYSKASLLYSSVDIAIPTMTVHGTADAYVHYSQALVFYDAVTEAGNSDLYRLYKVANAMHVDLAVNMEMRLRFDQLVSWVKDGTPAPPSVI